MNQIIEKLGFYSLNFHSMKNDDERVDEGDNFY